MSLHSAITQTGYPSVIVSASPGPDGYPTLIGFGPVPGVEGAGLRLGDRLLQVGGTDLRGEGHIALYAPFARAGREQHPIAVRFAREDSVEATSLPVGSYRMYWPRLPASLLFALAALLLHLRASSKAMARAFAQTFMCAALFLACTFGGSNPVTYFAIAIHLVSVALVVPLALRATLLFPHGDPPTRFLARTGPWVFVLLGLFDGSRFYEFVFPRQVGVMAMTIGDLAFFLLVLGIATHTYRRSDAVGRRQIKWVLLGAYLAVAFPIATVVLVAMDLDFISVMVTSMATLGFIPISLVIAITRYNLFDIDRLISATASYTILAVVVVAGFLSGVPAATRALAGPIGVEAGTTQVVLSLLLATVLVPCHRLLSPRIERVLYPERHALAQGIERLLEQLSACQDPRELVRLAGECLDALVRPESCAIYARDESISEADPLSAFTAFSRAVRSLERPSMCFQTSVFQTVRAFSLTERPPVVTMRCPSHRKTASPALSPPHRTLASYRNNRVC